MKPYFYIFGSTLSLFRHSCDYKSRRLFKPEKRGERIWEGHGFERDKVGKVEYRNEEVGRWQGMEIGGLFT